MKKWLAFMLVFVLAFVIVGCKPEPVEEDILVTGVTADVLTKEIAVNEKFIIKATVAPANATNKSVSFASDKVSVATVNSATGEVKGIAPGVAVITVSSSNAKTATVTVTVIEAVKEATSITVKDPSKTIEVSEKYTILATVLPIDAANKTVTFTSSDASVAKVNASTGEVEGLKVGTATIIATTFNKLTATVSITVVADSNVLVITNAPAKMAIEEIAELEINLEGTPSWVSKDETVATVDQDGKVTALSAGTVIIEVTLGEAKAQVTILVEVKDDKAFKLTAPEDRTEIAVDFSLTLSAKKGDLLLSGTTTFEVTMDPVGVVEWEELKDDFNNPQHKIRLDAKLAGTVTVKATNGTDVAEYTVTVIARPEPVSFVISGNIEIEIGNNATMRVVDVLPLYAKRTVIWSISDETVATIDPATGVVKGITLGNVVVTATYSENAEIKATLEVAIVPEEVIDPGHVDPEVIFVAGYESIFTNETYQFNAEVGPAGANQEVIWSISPESVATISSKGVVKGISVGTANIMVKAEKEDGTFVTARYRVTVSEAPVIPDPENLGGYVITIMEAEQVVATHDPFNEDYRGIDKAHKARAWNEVKALYNCDFQVVAYPNTAPWGPVRWGWINSNANTGTAQADFYIITSSIIDQLDASHALFDTNNFYKEFGKNSMQTGLKESVSYKGGLYAMSTGTYAQNFIDTGLYFNVGLVEELGLENPAQMFLEGRWTYSAFEQYAIEAQARLGEGQFALSGEPMYYWTGMVNAAGIKIADTNQVKLNLDGANQKQAARTLRNIVNAQAFDVVGHNWDADVVSFKDGNAIFQSGEMWFCKQADRWPVNMWGEGTTKFGYVPYPRPNEMPVANARVAIKGQAVYSMANYREANHALTGATYQGVFRALNEMFLRTTAYSKEDLSMNEQDIRTQNAAIFLDDQASMQAVLFFSADKIVFDPFEIIINLYESPLNTAIRDIVFNGDDFSTKMEANKATTETAFLNKYAHN